MTPSFVGDTWTTEPGESLSTGVAYNPSAVGNVMVVWMLYFSNIGYNFVFNDNTGANTWNNLFLSNNPTSYGGCGAWWTVLNNIGTGNFVMTLSNTNGPDAITTDLTFGALEYTGLNASPFVSGEYSFNDQSSGGDGNTPNFCTSGNTPTLSSAPVLLVGGSYDTNNPDIMSAGTGFNARLSIAVGGAGSSFYQGLMEDMLYDGTSPVAATFTGGNATGVQPVSFVIALHYTPSVAPLQPYALGGTQFFSQDRVVG